MTTALHKEAPKVPRESRSDLKKRLAAITKTLRKRYPGARTALNYSTPLELLVATILSAQCTDARVNIVTASLFAKYRTAKDYADAPQDVLAAEIRSTGFYRNKAASIKGACTQILEDHSGQVPGTMDALVALPGVGRKTANVVLGNAFDTPGITCDTHVIRLVPALEHPELDVAQAVAHRITETAL